ncbi:hypothetical protein GCM10009416_30460 [Craurococcus roseus]|uniref:Uncharacterized protein n=1 Tax=Craurococcus roseus TaxID=77585 RepID=A0ABP3QF78_9PROT
MSGQNDPKTTQERTDRTPDNNVEAAVEGTFPASDPMGTVASQGARAVPMDELMRGGGDKPQSGTATLTARFDGMESAKLAVEALVRDGPVDRGCAEFERAGDAATVRLAVPQADKQRLEEMLHRQPGRTG